MKITITATEQDMARYNGTEQDFHEIVELYWSSPEELLSWLTDAAQAAMSDFLWDTEPFTFEPPKHEGKVLMEVVVPLEEIYTELLDCEIGEILQEAAMGAYRSGEILWKVEWLFWDIIESGMEGEEVENAG